MGWRVKAVAFQARLANTMLSANRSCGVSSGFAAKCFCQGQLVDCGRAHFKCTVSLAGYRNGREAVKKHLEGEWPER